jgi:hypothetical protein
VRAWEKSGSRAAVRQIACRALLDGTVRKDNVTDWGSTRLPIPRYPLNRVAY